MSPSAWTVVVVVISACVPPHAMERAAPVRGHCPAEISQEALPTTPDATELHWFRASEERDRRLAAQWCATVGPADYRLDPAPSFPAWNRDQGLEVVSWNTYVGGGDLYRMLRDEVGLDCTAPTSGPPPFVLLVQEVWRYDESLPTVESSSIIPVTIDHGREAEEGPSIVDLARRCGLAYVYVPSARNGPDNGSRPSVDKGNAVLSSVPLSSPIALDLPLEGGRKVAVAATVRAPGGEAVRFVSAHLDVASTLVRTLVTGNQTRARQALGLIDGLRRAERGGLAVSATVVGADLNTWVGNEASLRLMWGAFPESPPWDGLGTWRMGLPLDHMFFRRDPDIALDVEGYRRIPDRYGSDHHGRRFTLIHGVAGPSASDRR